MRTITLEEHFGSRRFLDVAGIDLRGQQGLDLSGSEVTDLADLRLRHMDESGIDLQIISHVLPTFTPIPPSQYRDIATAANDQAAAAVAAHPDRFAAFAALPMSDPEAAVAELRRAVTQLGFVGALINGRANGTFLDAPGYRPLLQTAVDLNVPLYLHPGLPTPTLREEHYSGFGPSVSYALATAAWGWHAETGLHALRLIAAGIFDQLPDLQIILGHMGEMIPFMLNRADEWLTPAARTENNLQLSVAETFRRNFWITTSGMFSSPQFLLLHQVLGPDRLLFSIDYPFSPNTQGRAFLDALEINPTDKEKLSHRNAECLLRLRSIASASPASRADH
jgi:predicted TIM-barrel fold metal-dependent hydrolase